MSSGLRRTLLFNRRFALSRKGALGMAAGRPSIKQDAEGFDDLDEYFEDDYRAAPAAGRISKRMAEREQEWIDEPVQKRTTTGEGGDSYQQYQRQTMDDMVPLNEDAGDSYHNDDGGDFGENVTISNNGDEGYPEGVENAVEDDNELSFSKTIKLTPSPTATRAPLIARRSVTAAKLAVKSAKSAKLAKTTQSTQTTQSAGSAKSARRSRFEPIVNVKLGGDQEDEDDYLRRSKRSRIPPLAYWRNEKVIYGRRQSSKMPVIIDVLRKGGEESPTKRGRAASHPRRRHPHASSSATKDTLRRAGLIPHVNVAAKVMDYDTHRETERLLALGADGIQVSTVSGEDFGIQTIFTEGSFLSSGILEFPPGSAKPSRSSSKHALVFYVIEGTVEVTIHVTSFVVGTGSQFVVPRGNHYAIRSVWNRTSRLFFCHCKDTLADS